MKTRFENLILLLFTAAFAWMFYAGIQGVAGDRKSTRLNSSH